jgi:glycosyltransferase involved in cell wall biosynthesis
MKILHIVPSYKPAFVYGGPIYSVSALCEAQTLNGDEVVVYTTNANGSRNLSEKLNTEHKINGVKVYYFNRITGDHTHISPSLWIKLFTNCKDFDFIHIHSWWSILVIGCAMILNLKRIKFIISPRGMFSPYSMMYNNNPLKSEIFMKYFIKPLLKKQIFHTTALSEQEEIKNLFSSKVKVFTLPNLLKFPKLPSIEYYNDVISNDNKFLKLLFISRIDKKKGIEILLNSIPIIIESGLNIKLTIIGTGDKKYIESLYSLSKQLDIDKYISWKGNVEWELKFNDILENDILILPSYNENFANIILETLYAGKPVILSKYVGLNDYVKENNFGWVIDTNPEDLSQAISQFYIKRNDFVSIAAKMREKVRADFDSKQLTKMYEKSYRGLSI